MNPELPVRSAVLKHCTGGLVVRWVTTSEYPLLYVFALLFAPDDEVSNQGRCLRRPTLMTIDQITEEVDRRAEVLPYASPATALQLPWPRSLGTAHFLHCSRNALGVNCLCPPVEQLYTDPLPTPT